jgi:hypothetical protein
MATIFYSNFDQSKYLGAKDIGDGNIGAKKRLTIKAITEEVVGIGDKKETKLCVWFANCEKGLLLNKTNMRALRSFFGDEGSKSVGKDVIVFVAEAEYQGKRGPALRVRLPVLKEKAQPPPRPTDDEDDEDAAA